MPPPPAARFLRATLLANAAVHAAAIATMGLCLLPGIPGGPTADVTQRADYVATHPWIWRLGWLPWHLCALADLVTAIAIVSTRWIPRLPALVTLAVTLNGVVAEQLGEIAWVTRGVGLAALGRYGSGEWIRYAAFEHFVMLLTAEYAASVYMVMAACWTWCFVAAGTWSRTLTWLSVATWGNLAVGSLGLLLLPETLRPGPLVVAATSGVGFPLLVAWLWLVARRVRSTSGFLA